MILIKLKTKKSEFWVNPEYIVSMFQIDYGFTYIETRIGNMTVENTPEEIIRKIKVAYKNWEK